MIAHKSLVSQPPLLARSVTTDASGLGANVRDVLQRASSEPAQPLDKRVGAPLGQALGHNFANVRVHNGPHSAQAADQFGARAFTLGRDIYLGHEAHRMGGVQRDRLLAHEAVHTAQQGGRSVAANENLAVSQPNDSAEVEADTISRSIFSGAGGNGMTNASAMNGDFAVSPVSTPAISRITKPLIQRDLKGKQKVKDGTFHLDLKTESHPGTKNGMSGTIKFKASKKAPDSKNIRLLQIVRDKNLTTKKDYVWTGGEADRNKMMTSKNRRKGIKPGFFVDHSAAMATPRTSKGDAAASPYYRDYWPSPTRSQDGSKSGKTVTEASLWDYPGSGGNRRFSFETAAKAADTGYIYATLRWGFTIKDASKGKVTKEYAKAHRGPSKTFKAAVKEFDEFYKNPGASTAPTK